MQHPSKQTKFGAMIGFGFIGGKGHFPAYLTSQNDLQIQVIVDPTLERQKAAQAMGIEVLDLPVFEKLGSPSLPKGKILWLSDIQELFKLLDTKKLYLDFVDICTPPALHFEMAKQALEKGLHVLCEKPITTSLEQAKKLLEIARTTQKTFFPAHNYLHAPVVKKIRSYLNEGKIGNLVSAQLTTYRNTHAKGVLEWNTHWRRQHEWSGGGIAMDHGSHTFYLTFDWFQEYPTAVSAQMLTLGTNAQGQSYDTEDYYQCSLRFSKQRVSSSLLTWNAGMRRVQYTLQGTQGALTVSDDDLEWIEMKATGGEDVAQGAVQFITHKESLASNWMDASHVTWYGSLYKQFADVAWGGQKMNRFPNDAYHCIQVIEKSYQSAKSGGIWVPLEGSI